MLYTKADGSGGVTNTPQAGWVPISGTDNMTSGTQIGYKPATYVPGTTTVATPASYVPPATGVRMNSNVAQQTQGVLLPAPPPAAPAAPAAPPAAPAAPPAAKAPPAKADPPPGTPPSPNNPPAPQGSGDHDNPLNEQEKSIDVEGPQTLEEAVEGGFITQEEANQLSMQEVEKLVWIDPKMPPEMRQKVLNSVQLFLIQAAIRGYLPQVIQQIKDNPANSSGYGSQNPAGTMPFTWNNQNPGGGVVAGEDVGNSEGVDLGQGTTSYSDEGITTLVFHEAGHSIFGMQHSGASDINDTNLPAEGFNENFWNWSDLLFKDPGRWGADFTNPNLSKDHGMRDKGGPGTTPPGSNVVSAPPAAPTPSTTDPGNGDPPPETDTSTPNVPTNTSRPTGGPPSTTGPGLVPVSTPVTPGAPLSPVSRLQPLQPLPMLTSPSGVRPDGGLEASAAGPDGGFDPASVGMATLDGAPPGSEGDIDDPEMGGAAIAPRPYDARSQGQSSFQTELARVLEREKFEKRLGGVLAAR